MHHDASTGNEQINGPVATPRRKQRRVSVPDVEEHALTERLSVMQVINEKSDAAIEHGLVNGGLDESNVKDLDFCGAMFPVFLMASDRVKASFVNIHLVGECFDSLIIIRFAVENQTPETRLMSHGKRMLFIADKSCEIWRRGERVERELINNADQTYEHHIIYPPGSWVKFADIPTIHEKVSPRLEVSTQTIVSLPFSGKPRKSSASQRYSVRPSLEWRGTRCQTKVLS